jgi:hypothetical protein
MSELFQIQERLQESGAAIARLETALIEHPTSPSLGANLRSLRKMQKSLEADFLRAADDRGLDVCSYRIAPQFQMANAATLSKVLGTFQTVFSLMYEAVRTGQPKSDKRPSGDAEGKTELLVAYTFSGSLGVVFALPNPRLHFYGPDVPTYLDEAMNALFRLAKANESAEIAVAARTFGLGPINAVYDWAKGHAQHHINANIEWLRSETVRDSVTVQYPEFERLSRVIERTSEESQVEIVVDGTLVGADVMSRRFHFVDQTDEDEPDIRGRFSEAISESERKQLPGRYRATLRKTIRKNYSTNEEDISWFLMKLAPLDNQ